MSFFVFILILIGIGLLVYYGLAKIALIAILAGVTLFVGSAIVVAIWEHFPSKSNFTA